MAFPPLVTSVMAEVKAYVHSSREASLCLSFFDIDNPWSYPHEPAAIAGLAASGFAAKALRVSGTRPWTMRSGLLLNHAEDRMVGSNSALL